MVFFCKGPILLCLWFMGAMLVLLLLRCAVKWSKPCRTPNQILSDWHFWRNILGNLFMIQTCGAYPTLTNNESNIIFCCQEHFEDILRKKFIKKRLAEMEKLKNKGKKASDQIQTCFLLSINFYNPSPRWRDFLSWMRMGVDEAQVGIPFLIVIVACHFGWRSQLLFQIESNFPKKCLHACAGHLYNKQCGDDFPVLRQTYQLRKRSRHIHL